MRLNFGQATLPALVLLFLLGVFLLVLSFLRARRGRAAVEGQTLPALEALQAALHRAAEMGETVHVSPGTGSLGGGGRAAETFAGLEVVGSVAEQAFSLGVPIVSSANDALVHIAVGRLLERAREKTGAPRELEARCLWLAQQDRMAYAAGAVDLLSRPEVRSNVLVGAFDEELALLLDAGSRGTGFQLAGVASPAGVPFLPLSGGAFLLGEEIFAAGAYLRPSPSRAAGVATQDVVRLVVIVLILIGVVVASLGGPVQLLQSLFWMPLP